VIRYDLKRNADGSFHPRSFVLGHKIGRALGRSLGYTDDQLNSIDNLQPECRSCSTKTGAQAGYRAQQAAKRKKVTRYLDSQAEVRTLGQW
jgi:hypothetical protein